MKKEGECYDEVGTDGLTPLGRACQYKANSPVRSLVEKGASPQFLFKLNTTPLSFAVDKRNPYAV